MTTARGTIRHDNWDENPFHELADQKATKADIACVFDGDLEATAKTAFLMHYPDDKSAHYTGYLWVDGTLAGKKGTFVLFETGGWADGVARSNWEIVPRSGTGDLKGISGTGSYAAEHDKTVRYTLDYELPA
jgi:hypothetical protein